MDIKNEIMDSLHITQMQADVVNISHDIVDAKKLKLYSPYIIENIEELYEIDSVSLNINTIFYEKNKYRRIVEGTNIFLAIKEQVHPDYVDALNSVFQSESLQKMIHEKRTRQVECKVIMISGEYCWVEAKVFPVDMDGRNKLLFCINDISDKKRVDDLTNEKNEMIEAFYNIYSSIAEIDLHMEQVYILKSDTENLNQKILSVTELYQVLLKDFVIVSEKSELKRFFDVNFLRSVAEKEDNYSFDFQLKEEGRQFRWKRIETLCVPHNKNKLYIVFSDVDEKHILDSLLKHFVFNNNDYLYYIDVKNDFFLNFNKTADNVVLPPQSGDNYEKAMEDYTKKYVAPEDQDRVMELMKRDYMAKRLEKEDSYKIEAGMMDETGRYKRKEVIIQNYDKENQILFMSRKDITTEYFRQKNQSETLATAQRMADTDILTNLCNRQGASREIEERLLEMKDEMDAFIIIDLDNFKLVNDCLGHLQGDDLLRKTAKILKDNFRKTDVVARLGGDEFIIYMKDVKEKRIIVKVVEKLIKKLQVTYPWENGEISVSASIGIAVAPLDGMCFEDLYQKSDKALYRAKRQGKNRFSFFDIGETSN